jgi:quercetin dioxygenase-like cupin family protein
MGAAGDRYELPEGSVYELRRPVSETGGDLVEWEFALPEGATAPPPHRHPAQTEEYEVIEGSVELLLDGAWRRVGAGEAAAVPPGAAHTFRVPAGGVRLLDRHSPALGFEDYLERLLAVVVEHGARNPRSPKLGLYVAVLLQQYPDTMLLTRAPERIALGAAAAVGRVLGVQRRLPPAHYAAAGR